MKILVIDDEEKIRNVIREYLEVQKYEVDEAENGSIAYNKILNNNYDLLVMAILY